MPTDELLLRKPGDYADCLITSARMCAQLQVGYFSLALNIATLLILTAQYPHHPAWLTVLFILINFTVGGCERYQAARIHADASIFTALAVTNDVLQLQAIDKSLHAILGLPKVKAGRDIQKRLAGALRLVKIHSGVVLIQMLFTLLTLLLAFKGGI